MKNPIGIEIDLEFHVAYVRYHEIPDGAVTRSDRVSEEVVIDYGAANDILGIELLATDDASLAKATDFAHSHGLAFPRHLNAIPA